MTSNKVVLICGPTATGKTALGVALAERLGGEVVGADSMQIYRRMDIGTAKPTKDEMRGVVHHMIDIADPSESYNVTRYVSEAGAIVDDILARGKVPVIVGGTNQYIDALVSGTVFSDEGEDTSLRLALEEEYDALGAEAMLKKLAEFDPDRAEKLHANDKKRVIRAMEVYLKTGKTITQTDAESTPSAPRYDAARICLSFRDRQDLYDRINLRVDKMFDLGLVDEVKALLAEGIDGRSTALQAIGYKEIISHLRGEITLDEAVYLIKRDSRRYAKRQLSWLRRFDSAHWILWEKQPDFEFALLDSTAFLAERGYNTAEGATSAEPKI